MTKSEEEIIDREFEELLRHIVSSYIKLTGDFDSFETFIDTHQEIKEIYDIKITRRLKMDNYNLAQQG